MPQSSRVFLVALLCAVCVPCLIVTLAASPGRHVDHPTSPLPDGRAATETVPQPFALLPDAALAGAKLFRRHCMDCHGSTAEGGDTGPSLRTPDVLKASPKELFSVLTNGDLRRGMPSWSRLPDERRWQLVIYIKSLAPSGSGTF